MYCWKTWFCRISVFLVFLLLLGIRMLQIIFFCLFQEVVRKRKKRKSGTNLAASQAISDLSLVAIGTASGNILLYSVVKGDLHSQLVCIHILHSPLVVSEI